MVGSVFKTGAGQTMLWVGSIPSHLRHIISMGYVQPVFLESYEEYFRA